MASILGQIKHLVVVMLENRSLDNLCGWLYSSQAPNLFLPGDSPAAFDGLTTAMFNPSNADYFAGKPAVPVFAAQGASSATAPDPDPQETFDDVTRQIYGPDGWSSAPPHPMQGFVLDYATVSGVGDPGRIMQAHLPSQVPVLSQLALGFAISDAWFAPVPSQTWPNRAFAHTGTSNGRVNNGEPPDPLQWDVPTIFNVLSSQNVEWAVYSDTLITPSLTRTMFPALWGEEAGDHFHGFGAFEQDCAGGTLPHYSFLEPSFLVEPNDAHPPHDVGAAEQLLLRIWNAVSTSPAWNETLLIITFDEHGGCHDHVLPPGAVPPDAAGTPGDEGFGFDRFGVRVPTILVSPYIQAGTVFRSPTSVAFDHTSILATLRDWLGIPNAAMLPSRRIAAAPTFHEVLTLQVPRPDRPALSAVNAAPASLPAAAPPNDLQRSLVAGTARRLNMDGKRTLDGIKTRQQAIDFFAQHPEMSQR